jgi:hypothetical protein
MGPFEIENAQTWSHMTGFIQLSLLFPIPISAVRLPPPVVIQPDWVYPRSMPITTTKNNNNNTSSSIIIIIIIINFPIIPIIPHPLPMAVMASLHFIPLRPGVAPNSGVPMSTPLLLANPISSIQISRPARLKVGQLMGMIIA